MILFVFSWGLHFIHCVKCDLTTLYRPIWKLIRRIKYRENNKYVSKTFICNKV